MKISNNFTVNKIQTSSKKASFKTSPANDTFVKSSLTSQTLTFKAIWGGFFSPQYKDRFQEIKRIKETKNDNLKSLTRYLVGKDSDFKNAALVRLNTGLIPLELYPIIQTIAANREEKVETRVLAIDKMAYNDKSIEILEKLKDDTNESIARVAYKRYLNTLNVELKLDKLYEECQKIFAARKLDFISANQKEIMTEALVIMPTNLHHKSIRKVLLPFIDSNCELLSENQRLDMYTRMEADIHHYAGDELDSGKINNAGFYKDEVLPRETNSTEILCRALEKYGEAIKVDSCKQKDEYKSAIVNNLTHKSPEVQIKAAQTLADVGSREDVDDIEKALNIQTKRSIEYKQARLNDIHKLGEGDFQDLRDEIDETFGDVQIELNNAVRKLEKDVPARILKRENDIYKMLEGESLKITGAPGCDFIIKKLDKPTEQFNAGDTVIQAITMISPILKQPNGFDINLATVENPVYKLRTGQKLYVPGESTFTRIKLPDRKSQLKD